MTQVSGAVHIPLATQATAHQPTERSCKHCQGKMVLAQENIGDVVKYAYFDERAKIMICADCDQSMVTLLDGRSKCVNCGGWETSFSI